MPLEITDQRHLTAAVGYLELGMFEDAETELDAINPDVRHLTQVLEIRMEIYLRQKEWERMQGIAVRLMRTDPNNPQWAISFAFATRRARSISAAKAILLEALVNHPKEPMISYNLACYECQLGNLDSAKLYLEQAIKMNPGFREGALKDVDLEPLWDSLGTEMVQ